MKELAEAAARATSQKEQEDRLGKAHVDPHTAGKGKAAMREKHRRDKKI